ncbi:MAG: tyrosine-type recombinase/integrase [Clostridiales Family XIII bacterium]|jgi:site-specific recombinase XerD|nr:tyrosine-type recombinase/integrase [Clostridiales Family XIII bacterium]
MDTQGIHIHNKSGKPDNIVLKEVMTEEKCAEIEAGLPSFLLGFFRYLKGNLLPLSRLAYLRDIRFFLDYLIHETDLTRAENIRDIKQAEFAGIKAVDINIYLDYLRKYKVRQGGGVYVYHNDNKSLARKRSSISVLFKYLYRDEMIEKNITDGFDPIRLPKAGDKEIKHLEENEIMLMLDAVASAEGLTKKEKQYWAKTKLRDRAMLLLFLTYGLRLSELQQLNVSSFNFGRGEFKIFRKRGKEAIMPISDTVSKALKAYVDGERPAPAAAAPGDPDADALFLSLQGGRMTERQIRQLVKKYTSIALGTGRDEGYSPHKLRATTATSLIERGHSIFDVQELLNHDNITTTQLYAAHRKGAKRELVKELEWDEV